MARLQPGLVVRVRPDSQQAAAMKRLETCNGSDHDGWETPGRPFLLTRQEGKAWRLCPICEDPITSDDLPTPVPLGIGEADIIKKITYLHIGVSMVVDEKFVQTWTLSGPAKRLAGFPEPRRTQLLREFAKHWPIAPSKPELQSVK